MLFPEKEILLKDGRTALLRTPREEDAEELLEYLRAVSGETEFLTEAGRQEKKESLAALEANGTERGIKYMLRGWILIMAARI